MATSSSSSSSKSLQLHCKSSGNMLVLVLFMILILLSGFCGAIRTGKTSYGESRDQQILKRKNEYRARGDLVFNFFPKGIPIPPSGPSKTHNSVVDSTPHN
ncbi:hypothetical protein QN277_003960 [Acacia crassicarpa]|uniref:Uncharacterized protein n=1 Tax=Acacia crassicarpa TaxID=499986 RepID=A0AAE1JX05_9FABA|nr:hypothetical protein QN277_003960 [Acacia crassicarpa]